MDRSDSHDLRRRCRHVRELRRSITETQHAGNDESGFCVLRVKVRGQRDETTVIGSLPSVTAGEWLSADGWWVRDKEHGLWANLLCRAKTQRWVEMGAAHVEQVSSRGCHLDSAVPTTKLHSFAEL